MAQGMPDYSKDVRPRYGAAQRASFADYVIASEVTQLVEVLGKGMIYGGSLLISLGLTQAHSSPVLMIDGSEIASGSLFNLNYASLGLPLVEPGFILKYDDVTFVYAVGISPGITFETGFEVLFDEFYGQTPLVSCRIIYALI